MIRAILLTLCLSLSVSVASAADLVVFTARWCNGCQRMKPAIQAVRREGFAVRELDIDVPDNRRLYDQIGAQTIPALVVVEVGARSAVKNVTEQVMSEAELRRYLQAWEVSKR